MPLLFALSSSLPADCIKKQDHRSNKNSGVLVPDLIISGVQTLSSDELDRIRGRSEDAMTRIQTNSKCASANYFRIAGISP